MDGGPLMNPITVHLPVSTVTIVPGGASVSIVIQINSSSETALVSVGGLDRSEQRLLVVAVECPQEVTVSESGVRCNFSSFGFARAVEHLAEGKRVAQTRWIEASVLISWC